MLATALTALLLLAPGDDELRRGAATIASRDARALGVGAFVPEATVATLDGERAALRDHAGERGLVVSLVSTTCPVGMKMAPAIARAEERAIAAGFGFVHVGVQGLDTVTQLREYAKKNGLEAPVVQDDRGEVARALAARTTTEVFLVDARGTLQYRGAISDQYGIGYALPEARNEFLEDAFGALAEGRLDRIPGSTHAPGCVVEPPDADADEAPVTYARHVSRILQRNCVECHTDGGIAPFALDDYRSVAPRATMVRAVVEDGLMPPWFAAHEDGPSRWVGDRSLLPEERDLLTRWIEGGKPEGDPAELPLEVERKPGGWQLGLPDAVYAMPRAFEVPAEGRVAYQYFAVPTSLERDTWIDAIEVRPGARNVVHHVLAYPLPESAFENGRLRRWDLVDERRGFFAAWAPGAEPVVYPEGHARLLPARTVLLLELHYTPNGAPARDLTQIGVHFASQDPDWRPRHVVRTAGISNRLLRVPAGASDHESGSMGIAGRDLLVHSFMPHMHLRGRSFRFERVSRAEPDAPSLLLDVPEYDFNWQLRYELREPVLVHAGDRIDVTAVYDNSSRNLANPDPDSPVRWGPDTDDEMLIGFIDYTLAGGDEATDPLSRDLAILQPATLVALRRLAADAGGEIPRSAIPRASREGFDLLDLDDDGVLDGEELWFLGDDAADEGK